MRFFALVGAGIKFSGVEAGGGFSARVGFLPRGLASLLGRGTLFFTCSPLTFLAALVFPAFGEFLEAEVESSFVHELDAFDHLMPIEQRVLVGVIGKQCLIFIAEGLLEEQVVCGSEVRVPVAGYLCL